LPRHILEESFPSGGGALDAFAAQPFWTTAYVGVGPYRVERWEPGASLESSAFDRYALGRPKVQRFRLVFIGDPNTVLANLLSGTLHFAGTGAIYYQQASVLRREWAPRNTGLILVAPGGWRYTHIQLRPEIAEPRSLLDVRVRRGLLHAVDKKGLNEALFDGQGIMAETSVWPTVDYFQEMDRAVAKYPFDIRRSEQLMGEAGYTRGPDGVFASAADGRFATELAVIAQAQNEAEMSIMAAGWRNAGFEVRESVMPTVQAQSGQIRASFTGLFTSGAGSGESILANMTTAGIPRPENRWTGSNRGAWSNADYDRLFEAFTTTLDRAERNRQIIAMMKIFTEELPDFALYFQPSITAHVSELTGVDQSGNGWNVQTWEFR
jgi:peptide/nickel transport system substrate-binding protein